MTSDNPSYRPAAEKEVPENSTSKATAKKIVDEAIKVHKDILAIDIGYGDVKVKTSTDEFVYNSYVAPTLTASLLPGNAEDFVKDPLIAVNSLIVEYNGRHYAVGKNATANSPRVDRRTLSDRVVDPTLMILYMATLAAAYNRYNAVELYVVSGLPNEFYAMQQKEFAELLQSVTTVPYYIGGVKRVLRVNVANVHINTQPEGFYVDLMLDEALQPTGEWRNGRVFATADCGHYTLDYTLFRGRQAVGLNQRYTGSTDGIYRIYEGVSSGIKAEYRTVPSPKQIDEIVRTGKFQFRVNDAKDVSADILAPLCKKYAADVFEILFEAWQDVLPEMDAIFLEGGGAELIAPYLNELFKEKAQFEMVYVSLDAQVRNVRGYYKLGRHLYGKVIANG